MTGAEADQAREPTLNSKLLKPFHSRQIIDLMGDGYQMNPH